MAIVETMPFARAAGGAAGAVDVVLDVLGDVEVDDVLDAGDVDAAAGDVGGDEDAVLTFAESLQRADAFVLRLVGVNARHRMSLALEDVEEPLGVDFSAREDERRSELLMQERDQRVALVGFLHEIEPVA